MEQQLKKLRLLQSEAERFDVVIEELREARGNLDTVFTNLDTVLGNGCDAYDGGEEDREHLYLFREGMNELEWLVSDAFSECQHRLASIKRRWEITNDVDIFAVSGKQREYVREALERVKPARPSEVTAAPT